MPDQPTPPKAPRPSVREHPLEWALSLFADVRPGEGGTALLLTLNVFLLLMAYYFLKVAREPLILVGKGGGAEIKSYASVGQSILLVFVTTAYGWLGARVDRMRLIAWVTMIFVANLVGFWFLGERGVPLGIPFFLWVGIFNLMSVAQFWSFAADLYEDEQGKRLFPIIGIGSSVGAVAGSWIADRFSTLGPYRLMLMAAVLLVVTLGLTFVTNKREGSQASSGVAAKEKQEHLGGANGFSLVMKDKYLLLFAGLIFFLNWVTKTGDYVLDSKLIAAAKAAGHISHDEASLYIFQFKARYFAWSNGIGVFLQLFVVSRIVKYLGLRVALILMPIASLAGYGASFIVPALGVLFAARAVESSLDYSLSNTTRQALWLVTNRDAKYKAKQVIDTFVVRIGDAMSAALVYVGSHIALSLTGFIGVNLVLTACWLLFAIMLGKVYLSRSADTQKKEKAEDHGAKSEGEGARG